jgi:small-conductance mechanosensitive channel
MNSYPLGLTRDLIEQAARPALVFLIALAALMAVRRLLLAGLYRHTGDAHAPAHVVLDAIRVPSVLWCLAGSLHLALEMSVVPDTYVGRAANVIIIFLVLSASLAAGSISVRLLELWGRRTGIAFATSGLASTLTRVVIFATGVLILLWIFGKSITPLLTALGVGGLALALALQDTLANFFAGMHILLEEPISVGDAIRLSETEEGVVTDIGWRTTRLRTGRNNIIVIPNTKITSGILTNYNLPDPRVVTELTVVIAHDADPGRAMQIALEELAAVRAALAEPAPKAVFTPGVLPTHIQFSLFFSVADFAQQGPALSEARLRILGRYRREGVPLPPPTR